MKSRKSNFTPAWASNTLINVILRKYRNSEHDFVSEAELIDECISSVPAFDDLDNDSQHLIFDLFCDAIGGLPDEDIILIDDVIFQINPNLADILIEKHEMCIIPRWGNA